MHHKTLAWLQNELPKCTPHLLHVNKMNYHWDTMEFTAIYVAWHLHKEADRVGHVSPPILLMDNSQLYPQFYNWLLKFAHFLSKFYVSNLLICSLYTFESFVYCIYISKGNKNIDFEKNMASLDMFLYNRWDVLSNSTESSRLIPSGNS